MRSESSEMFKEEEGVGISMGAHLAGMESAMLMQNHGFLALACSARKLVALLFCRDLMWEEAA